MGLTLSHLGFSFSALKFRPLWPTLPPTPPMIVASMTAPRHGAMVQSAMVASSSPAPASSPPSMVWGAAMNGRRSSAIWVEK